MIAKKLPANVFVTVIVTQATVIVAVAVILKKEVPVALDASNVAPAAATVLNVMQIITLTTMNV